MKESEPQLFNQGRTSRYWIGADKTQIGTSALPCFHYLCKSVSICGKKRLMSVANLTEQFSGECDLIRIL
jgi:hypothetical protein